MKKLIAFIKHQLFLIFISKIELNLWHLMLQVAPHILILFVTKEEKGYAMIIRNVHQYIKTCVRHVKILFLTRLFYIFFFIQFYLFCIFDRHTNNNFAQKTSF